jgi:hypothetical protein
MTSTQRATWPDTSDVPPPPADHLYRSATWLLGRHPKLAELVAWIPNIVTGSDDEDGPSLDLNALAEAIRRYDAHVNAWADYNRQDPAPDDDTAYDRWVAAGPTTTPAARALTIMSSTERTRLRLLASFATTRVPITVADFGSFDPAGSTLLADWCHAVQAA